jgi:tRNA pseudouridine32 synthase/23S rRNA pseudouridine746 synthase
MASETFQYSPPADDGLNILYQDEHLLGIDKPSGLLSVPGKPLAHRDCLESRVRERFSQARTVHRLDMDTSGVMVFALNGAAHRHLGLQFERRICRKSYIARVWGELEENDGEIDQPLRCDWPNRPKQMIDHELGRRALTRWQVETRELNATRLVLTPETGRSHQLRVHLQSIGHPILGDRFYAHDAAIAAAGRLQLHAAKLEIRHPVGGAWVELAAPLPF